MVATNSAFPTPWRFAQVAQSIQSNNGGNRNYTVSSGGTAEDISTALTRAQAQRYKDLIRPIEVANLKKLMDPRTQVTAANAAVATVNQGLRDSAGMELRNLSRYQTQQGSDQNAMIRRHGLLEASLDRAGAYNQTRQAVKDIQTQGMIDATQIGRNIAGQALQNSNTAANMQSQRKQAQDQYDSAQTAQMWNTLGTAAGLILAF